jgi:uncharacterized repeat protein (TIGR01451 family)
MKPFSVRTISLTIGVSIFSLLGIFAAQWLGHPTSNPLPFIAKVLTGNVTAFSPVTKKLPHPAPPPPPVSPTGDPGGFDIEGDLRANTPTANTSDWTPGVAGTGIGVLTAAGVPVDATKTFHPLDLFDSQNDNIFTGGSKVNDNPNTMWNWTLGKPTAKDDIHNGLLHLSTDANGHLWFVVGGDRLSNNGDSHINFEFLQNTLTRNANGTFTSAGPDGGRTVGDLLINIDLEMGGAAPSFDVMRWQAVGSGFDYVLITPAAGTAFVAANNTGTTPVSFGAFGATTYAQNQFGEAAIDITALIASLNPCIGVKTVFIKTATSQSASAALKDFIDPIQLNIGTNPVALAGDDQAACQANPEPTVFNLTGTAANGTPAWTVFGTTGSAAATITNPNTTTPTVNVTGTGTVTLRLTVTSQSCGAATDDVVLTVIGSPTANAGADQTQCQVGTLPTVFTLNGMVTAGSATPLWTILPSSTATAVIADANAATTTVTVTGTGFVELRLTSEVSCGTAIDTVLLTVNPSPVADAGANQTKCQTLPGPTVFTVNGTATNGTAQWSVLPGGTATATIVSPTSATTEVNVTGTGTVTLQLVVTSQSCGTATSQVTLTVNPLPTAAVTGSATICAGSSAQIEAALTGTGPWDVTWSDGVTQMGVVASPATRTVAPATTTIYTVTSVKDATGCTNPGTGSATVTVTNPPTTAAAGADQTLCLGSAATLTANTPSVGTGVWSIVSGPSTSLAQFSSASSPTATFTPAGGAGIYLLQWTISNAPCTASSDTVQLAVSNPPTPAAAGPDQTLCLTMGQGIDPLTPANLAANSPAVGTGVWSIVSGPSTALAQFSSTSAPNAVFTPAGGAGVYTLRWTISNAPCDASADDVVITYTEAPTEAAAGGDQTLCTTTPATLAANTPTVGTGLWSVVSGPSTAAAQFSSTATPNATFTPAGGAGSYTLRWTISNGVCPSSSDDVVLNYAAPPTPAAAGPDQSLCTVTPATLAANVPGVGTGLWSVVSGPSTAAAQFSSASSPTATFTPAGGAGTYTLRWTISNAPCTDSSDDVVLTYAAPPTAANAGPDQSLCPIGPVTLAANTPTVGTALWSIVSGPSTALAQFSSTSAPNATFTPAGGAGTYRLRWTIANAPCDASFDEVDIVASSSATVDAGANQTVSACTTSINLVGTIGGTATSATWSGGAGTFTPNATTLTATYTPTADEIAAGSVTLTLTTNDPPGSCDAARDQVTITFTPCADLSLDKKVDNTTPTLGQNVVFTLTLTNAGPSTATNVTVTDVLPAGLTFVSANPAASYSSATGIWTVGTLAAGTTVTLQITATVTQAGAISNTAEVTTSDQPDPDSTPDNHVPSEDDQSSVTLGAPGCPKSQSGSILVFPYYTSSLDSDTRLTISNLNSQTTAEQAYVHLFLMDGKSCSPADFFICLTPNASFSFKASEYDPMMTGYVIAVAVNKDGVPIANNVLIGNAFVQNGLGTADNYTAEKFFACSNPVVSPGSNMTELKFDGITYEEVPNSFAIEMQSPADAQQTLVTVGLNGDMTESAINGAAQVGVGQIYNGEERPFSSFSNWHLGGCQAINAINAVSPRVLTGVSGLIPSGDVGTIRLDVGSAVGLFFSANSSKGWNGIRGLHATRKTNTAKLKIPLIPPDC